MAIQSWGIGMRDYSLTIELSTIPVVTSWEKVATESAEIVVPLGTTVETEILAEGVETHYIFDIYVSVSANVMIRTEILQSGASIFDKYGVQHTDWNLIAGSPFDQLTVRITNYGVGDVIAYYSHHGVYGVEKIEPITIPGGV